MATDGWQPIETAPKDGTPIDLWVESDDPERPARRWPDMHWSDDHACNVGFDWTPHRQRTGIPLGGLLHKHVATHWRHLPPPPEIPRA